MAVKTQRDALETVSQAATELGLSVFTIRAWIAARKILYVRLGRAVRIPRSEISRLVERGTMPATRQDR
jgi:excisionase family DNA binding protein